MGTQHHQQATGSRLHSHLGTGKRWKLYPWINRMKKKPKPII